MPIEIGQGSVTLRGECTGEDAESLLEWLLEHPRGQVDLVELAHPHAVVLQVLMASQCQISAPPRDEFSAACLRLST